MCLGIIAKRAVPRRGDCCTTGVKRRLIHSVLLATLGTAIVSPLGATGDPGAPIASSALQRFLSLKDDSPVRYRALRHMEAKCEHFASAAWMDAWTEIDARGSLLYRIAGEGGSDYIRSKVFRGVLDAERKAMNSGAPNRAWITTDNYLFDHREGEAGLASVGITPRRKDMLLVDGSIFLRPGDGELVRIEGRLSKTPSFWVRRVDIVRHYRRFGGISMPIGVESVAQVRIAGRSTFRMTYEYETVNGVRVGNPQPRSEPEIEK
jgi:hypothetical protein